MTMRARRVVHKNIILLILALAQFMVVLDVSIMNVALPTIFKSLHFGSESNLQWVVTAYTLAFGGFLLLGGRAADLYGRRRLFLWAVGAFSAASLLSGLAQSSTMLEVTRALQGLAAGFMSPAALSLVLTTFKEGKERNKALSVWGAVAAGGGAAGVLLGGVLTQYLGWRWNFFVNVPVGLFVIIMTWLYVPESKADLDHTEMDLPGAVLVTGGLMLLVYGLAQAPTYGWGSHKTVEILAVSLLLLAAFVMNELRAKHPLMPFSIFRIRNVAAANLSQLPITASLFSMFFFITLYMQTVLNYSPVKAGFCALPVTAITGVVAGSMSHIVSKIGYKKPLTVAPLFMVAGLYLLAHVRVHGNYLHDILPGLACMAVGLGMAFVAITIAATNGVPHREAGLASGLLNTSQQIGGSLGLAILSGVSASHITSYITTHRGMSPGLLQASAKVNGFHAAFYMGMIFAVVSFFIALFFVHQQKGEKIAAEAIA